jgi:hypothetical protein
MNARQLHTQQLSTKQSPTEQSPNPPRDLAELLLTIPGVSLGKSFGRPAFSIADKIFAFEYQDGVVLKLPAERVQALLERNGFAVFQMRNKPVMREWVFLCRDEAGYEMDLEVFREAAQFVSRTAISKKHQQKRG